MAIVTRHARAETRPKWLGTDTAATPQALLLALEPVAASAEDPRCLAGPLCKEGQEQCWGWGRSGESRFAKQSAEGADTVSDGDPA